jgi:hypothetical protein
MGRVLRVARAPCFAAKVVQVPDHVIVVALTVEGFDQMPTDVRFMGYRKLKALWYHGYVTTVTKSFIGKKYSVRDLSEVCNDELQVIRPVNKGCCFLRLRQI